MQCIGLTPDPRIKRLVLILITRLEQDIARFPNSLIEIVVERMRVKILFRARAVDCDVNARRAHRMRYLALTYQSRAVRLVVQYGQSYSSANMNHKTTAQLTNSAAIVTVWLVTITGRMFACTYDQASPYGDQRSDVPYCW